MKQQRKGRGGPSSAKQQQQRNSSSGKETGDCLTLAGRVIMCLPGGRFKVQVDAAAEKAAAAVAHAFGGALGAPVGLRGKVLICTLSGKLRINRVYVHLHDFVIVETHPLSPTEGRIVFRIRENAAAAAAAPAAEGIF